MPGAANNLEECFSSHTTVQIVADTRLTIVAISFVGDIIIRCVAVFLEEVPTAEMTLHVTKSSAMTPFSKSKVKQECSRS